MPQVKKNHSKMLRNESIDFVVFMRTKNVIYAPNFEWEYIKTCVLQKNSDFFCPFTILLDFTVHHPGAWPLRFKIFSIRCTEAVLGIHILQELVRMTRLSSTYKIQS